MSSPPRRSTDNEVADFSPLVALAGRVADAVPPGSPTAWRGPAYRAVLNAVIRDRIENDTGDLEDGDVASLTDFVRAAAASAAAAPMEHRDDAFEIVLDGLLQDWVDNWNEPEDETD